MGAYRRVLLKLSGESLGGPAGKGIDEKWLAAYAEEVAEAVNDGLALIEFIALHAMRVSADQSVRTEVEDQTVAAGSLPEPAAELMLFSF